MSRSSDYIKRQARGKGYYPPESIQDGLTINSQMRNGSMANDFLFQGQERQDELDLGWSQFKWRNHDPTIGRFFNIDPLAEDYMYNSVYAFSENRVIDGVELERLEWETIKEIGKGFKQLGKKLKSSESYEDIKKGFEEAGQTVKQSVSEVKDTAGDAVEKTIDAIGEYIPQVIVDQN
ncbi:MAG: hypothetical protein OEX02_20625 [Cyclobacteriaceae bacterium]|nr:hypothetical protein [Cyclobacteriaceae bacterium]